MIDNHLVFQALLNAQAIPCVMLTPSVKKGVVYVNQDTLAMVSCVFVSILKLFAIFSLVLCAFNCTAVRTTVLVL